MLCCTTSPVALLQSGAIEHELSMLDRPEHSQDYDKTWDKPQASWGQELPAKSTGAPKTLPARVLRPLIDMLGWQGGEWASLTHCGCTCMLEVPCCCCGQGVEGGSVLGFNNM
jgi:hypothetical protein